MSPILLLKMFLDRRPFRGLSEFSFRPRIGKRSGLETIEVRSKSGSFTVWLRTGTTDAHVFRQVFIDNDYNLRRFSEHYPRIRAMYEKMSEPLILDLGANIGLSSLYFAKNFERARIVAIEPDPANFTALRRNVDPFEKISAVPAAIASRDGHVDVIASSSGAWASQTKLCDTGSIPAISVPSLLKMRSAAQPFIVKIDIEGFEEELFSANTDWLDVFPVLIIETHDWMLPGRANSRNLLKALAGRERDLLFHAENLVSIAIRWTS